MSNNPPPQSENFFNPKNINGDPNNQMNNKEVKEEPQQTTEVVIFKDNKESFDKTPNEQNPSTETDKNNNNNINNNLDKPKRKKSSIFGSTFMITNICLGTTIFTFAVRAKSFGLVWMLFFVLLLLQLIIGQLLDVFMQVLDVNMMIILK